MPHNVSPRWTDGLSDGVRLPLMPRVSITRTLHFSAAHRLARPDWSDERNREVFGDCSNVNWHGHNYELAVTVEGELDPETGYVMDLKRLKEVVRDAVVRDLDHRNLNLDVAWLEGTIPTTENLVVAIWERLAPRLEPAVKLRRLVLSETPRNRVEYEGA
jgi:6-pyruvoyltetrahydropterin/6-carboxytetrahydropterin synthase